VNRWPTGPVAVAVNGLQSCSKPYNPRITEGQEHLWWSDARRTTLDLLVRVPPFVPL